MKAVILTLCTFVCLPLLHAQNNVRLKSGSDADMNRISGYWYEISSMPGADGTKLSNVCVKLGKKDKEHMKRDVIGYTATGSKVKLKSNLTYMGQGMFDDEENGGIVILAVDNHYRYMLMGTADMQNVWVMSRTKTISPKMYELLVDKAAGMNYDITDVAMTSHK